MTWCAWIVFPAWAALNYNDLEFHKFIVDIIHCVVSCHSVLTSNYTELVAFPADIGRDPASPAHGSGQRLHVGKSRLFRWRVYAGQWNGRWHNMAAPIWSVTAKRTWHRGSSGVIFIIHARQKMHQPSPYIALYLHNYYRTAYPRTWDSVSCIQARTRNRLSKHRQRTQDCSSKQRLRTRGCSVFIMQAWTQHLWMFIQAKTPDSWLFIQAKTQDSGPFIHAWTRESRPFIQTKMKCFISQFSLNIITTHICFRFVHGSLFLDPTRPAPAKLWPDPAKLWPDPIRDFR